VRAYRRARKCQPVRGVARRAKGQRRASGAMGACHRFVARGSL
jgi:hypothetical protein